MKQITNKEYEEWQKYKAENPRRVFDSVQCSHDCAFT